MITQPQAEAYPGITSGTGFFARSDREVFFFTALHCLESKKQPISYLTMSERLTLPFRLEGRTRHDHDYVRFESAMRLAEDETLSTFVDVVALRVRPERKSNHRHLLSRAVKLPPNGMWLNNFVLSNQVQEAMGKGEAITFVVIGYPNEGTATDVEYKDVDSEPPAIHTQPAQLTGNLRRSALDNCLLLEDSTWPHKHTGFSGSPVFVQWKSEHGKLSALAGLVICGGNDRLHFVNVATLVKATERNFSDA